MELVLLIGLQGAGKSTFARMHCADSHIYVSRDLLRNTRQSSRRQIQLIEEALREDYSIVVDNTHATIADRAPIIALGRQFGAHILGYYFPPRVAESLARNQVRSSTARVPNVALYATAKRFQPPTFEEALTRSIKFVRAARRSPPHSRLSRTWRDDAVIDAERARRGFAEVPEVVARERGACRDP
ncbi:MAG TPA: AAA family ATPase [Ktedonobacterales bacterium]|jgi:predicted kinase|nr:AAA family ATPase [Ktedonobacterales bacterium]